MNNTSQSLVYLKQLPLDTKTLIDYFHHSFEKLSAYEDFEKAKAVFIKPNLTYPNYKKGVTTRKEFIESFIKALSRINSKTKIYIGESEGGYNSFSINDAFENMGFFEIEREFNQVKIINLSEIPSEIIKINTIKGIYQIRLPKIFFEEIDFSISCPVPKVHCMTRVSLSYKNLWGCLPDIMRLKNHYMFDNIISKISDILKFKYAFLDGKYGLNKNGPLIGEPIEVNWFAASNSLGAFDMIVSELMGFDWETIGHIKKAEAYGYLPKMEEIKIIGDVESLRKRFTLKREFWNYPALMAFTSRRLTELIYLSKFSKAIHDFMYIFRKKSIT